jgi:hypothetical protein
MAGNESVASRSICDNDNVVRWLPTFQIVIIRYDLLHYSTLFTVLNSERHSLCVVRSAFTVVRKIHLSWMYV